MAMKRAFIDPSENFAPTCNGRNFGINGACKIPKLKLLYPSLLINCFPL